MTQGNDPATSTETTRQTEVGSVFVSNYPPYSFWSPDQVDEVQAAYATPGDPDNPLGVYLHIPFCRRRCKFCYFKVYTDKNAAEVDRYLAALGKEADTLVTRPAVAGRAPTFLYVGGGTPSYLSSKHLRTLFDHLKDTFRWDAMREVTFECEPGTLTETKVAAIKEVGVTRLSLGIENWDDAILEENGRAHVSKEIHRALPWIRAAGFDQLNVDLIAGMVGETWETWRDTVQRTIDVDPDSVTIYQLELPYNTKYSKAVLDGTGPAVADWPTKRAWHAYAIEQFESSGYDVSSAYTVVKRGSGAGFVYRNSVWQGADLAPLGVSSFGHVGGVHLQNATGWEPYLERIEAGQPAVERAYRTTPDERLTRELILQLKLGVLGTGYFRDKFGVDVLERYADVFERLTTDGMLAVDGDTIRLTRDGLLRVDSLLPNFYAAEHRDSRYT